MSTVKIAITMDADIVKKVDLLVKEKRYPNRSRAIQEAVRERLLKIDKRRLAEESAKLDPGFERSLAEEGMGQEAERWPEY